MAGDDPDYCAWLRTQRCRMAVHDPCGGPLEVHHRRDMTGLGLRPPDRDAMPLCRKHHAALHGMVGPFRSMDKAARKSWELHQVAMLRTRWDLEQGRRG